MIRIKERLNILVTQWAAIETLPCRSHPHLALLLTELDELRNELFVLCTTEHPENKE